MRAQEEILREMIEQKQSIEELRELNSTSKTSVWRLFLYIISVAIARLEQLFALHKNEIDSLVTAKEPHRAAWYRNKALAFQLGHDLVDEKDYYDNTNVDAETVAASQVVKYAVAVEEDDKSTLYVKIAGANKQPLPEAQAVAFESYINEVADLGVHITVVNAPADQMRLEFDVYYDASVLSAEGKRLDGTGDTTVQDAVRAYLTNLEFNTQFVSMRLVDAVQKVEGVEIVELKTAQYKYKELSFQDVEARYTPYAGYMAVSKSNLKINWISE